jgi:hypothetical protein
MVVSHAFRRYRRTRTEICDLAPVPGPSMIINGVRSGARTHLLRAHAYWIDVGPPSFRVFAVRPTRVFQIVKRILQLTRPSMVSYMKLWQHEFGGTNLFWVHFHE